MTGTESDMSPIWWALCIHHSCLGILYRLCPFLFALGNPWHSAVSYRTSWGTAGCLGCLETRGDDLLQRLFNGKQKMYWVLLKLQWEPKLGISIFFQGQICRAVKDNYYLPFANCPSSSWASHMNPPVQHDCADSLFSDGRAALMGHAQTRSSLGALGDRNCFSFKLYF